MTKKQLYDLIEEIIMDYGQSPFKSMIDELVNLYFQKNDQYPKEYT